MNLSETWSLYDLFHGDSFTPRQWNVRERNWAYKASALLSSLFVLCVMPSADSAAC